MLIYNYYLYYINEILFLKGIIMGLTLIIVGLVISYFCWIQKREIEYIDKKNHENEIGIERIDDKGIKIQTKLLNNEKLTLIEWLHLYSHKITYSALKYGFYGGFVLSFIGFVLFVSVIFHFTTSMTV